MEFQNNAFTFLIHLFLRTFNIPTLIRDTNVAILFQKLIFSYPHDSVHRELYTNAKIISADLRGCVRE